MARTAVDLHDPLITTCERCRSPGGITVYNHEAYCPKCLPVHLLYDHGSDHLLEVTRSLAEVWARHLRKAGLPEFETFEIIGHTLREVAGDYEDRIKSRSWQPD